MAFEGVTCWLFLSISGRLFHDLGAKVLKALSPYEVLDLGMTRALCCPWDLSDLVGLYSLIVSLRYVGALGSWRAVYTSAITLKTMRWCTGNQ